MAKKVSENNIQDMSQDWGLDASNGLPYSGAAVQKFIKDTLGSKMGYFYYDASSNRYLCFADEASKDKYLANPTMTELVLGAFDAPFNYEASITMLTPSYKAVFLGSTGNYLDFTFDIKNKEGNSTGENVNVTYTFIRNASKKVVTETRKYGEAVHFNIDEYILEGTNTIIVGIAGQTTLAATTAAVTYQVVNLSLSDSMDISKVYNLSDGSKTVEVFFSVSGYGTKTVEWFLDGQQLPFVKAEDEIVDVTSDRTKYIELSNLTSGIHTLQARAYTVINGEKFYTDTLYREVMVYNGDMTGNLVAVAAGIPAAHGIVTESNPFLLYGIEQYIPYQLRFATRRTGNVSIHLGGELQATVTSTAGKESTYSITSNKAGALAVKLSVDDVDREIQASVNGSTLGIGEITGALDMDFRAEGKSNSSVDKDSWSYGEYEATFEGFNWNASSGWVDGSLLINAGASFSLDMAPLASDATATGKTLEFEFSTRGVEDDNAVICDLTTNGTGILITASEARLTSAAGEVVSTRFKAGEVNRIAFVINRKTGVTYKGLAFIYVNGILSGAVNYGSADNFISDKTLSFEGSADAQVELRSFRFYETALSAENILNNYILYRSSLEEMMEVYYRNEVYAEGTQTFSPEMMLHRLPVMVITGDIPTLEAATSTSTQILVDIEYTNEQDPSKDFRMKNAALRIQGTSSLAYPRKNFRFYTQKEESTVVYDAAGNILSDKLYSFKDGAQPVDCWCLKADFAESSGTHNTGIARIWNKAMFGAIIQHKNILGEEVNGYALRTQAQVKALASGYPYDVRTTIDGFPIVLFYKKNASDTDLIFLGKYNFNNDKSTPSVFGFENIPGFDNSRMQCWETKDNGHPLGLFTDISGFDANWSEAFESRYPDTKTPNTADLKAFSLWINGVSQDAFATEKWSHFDVYKVAAYYCYLMRFGAVDQPVKNAFLTSEDGVKYYFINYDNDTINGLINTGRLVLDPTVNRDTVGSDGEYVYAGHNSVLWNKLTADAEFMEIVSIVDNALYSAGLRYDEVIAEFNEEQADKWVERVYNQDAEYKYLLPYVNQATNNLFMLQGSRSSHRSWWLSKRFSLYDSLFVSGAYRDRNFSFKCLNDTQPGQKFSIKAGSDMNFGYGINNGLRETGVSLNAGRWHTFTTTDTLNLGDVVKIFGAANISSLDLSPMMTRLAVFDCSAASDNVLGSKLKELILGGNIYQEGSWLPLENTELSSISGINKLDALQSLNIAHYKAITTLDLTAQKDFRYLYARQSGLSSVDFAPGAPVEILELPSAMLALNLQQLPYLQSKNIRFESLSSLMGMTVVNCPNVSSDFDFVYDWILAKRTADADCTLIMDGINWNDVTGEQMERIASIGNISLRGRVRLTDITAEQGELFMQVFGENVFTEGADLYISAPVSVTIYGADSVLEGDSATYTSKIFPNVEGTVTYSLIGSRDGLSFDPETGILTTTENGLDTSSVTIKVVFVPADGEAPSESTKTVSVVKRTYPTDLSIEGDVDLKRNQTFSCSSSSDEESVNGEYIVEWLLGGGLSSYYSVQNNGSTCVLIQDQTPPTTLTGSLVVNLRKVVDNSIVASVSATVSFAYIYPSSVAVSGKNTIIGGASEVYSATITPSNYDIGVSYTWSVSGSSNVFVETTNGSTCTLGSNTPENEENFTLTCIVKSADNKVSIQGTLSVKLLTRPNFITATYNIETTGTYRLFYDYMNDSDITYMELDGVEITPSRSCTFDTIGLHIVKFTTTRIYFLFGNSPISPVVLDFSECNGMLYTDVSGTFSGCDKLETIIWGECKFPKAKDVNYLFNGCSSLTSIDLSPFTGSQVTNLSSTFAECSSLTSIDLSHLSSASVKYMDKTFRNCSSLTSIDLSPFTGSQVTDIREIFYGCESLTSINLSPLNNGEITNLYLAFNRCTSLTSIDLSPFKECTIGDWTDTFGYCINLSTIIAPWDVAPVLNTYTFGLESYNYTGVNTRDLLNNFLYVPVNSIGYDTGAWLDPLQDAKKCGFTLKLLFEPIECTSLTITADDVSGRKTNTTIHWTAIVNGVDSFSGEYKEGIVLAGTATSEEFPQNTSETETVDRVISYTYMGVTATTTIVQGVWVNSSYSVNLNAQWELSTAVANPDSALYDGVYQSFSNKGNDNTEARCYIDFVGYETFKVYIRSYAESKYDYVVISNLDAELSNNPTSTSTGVKSHTSGNQKSGTSISDYTLVEYTGLNGGEHRITVVYRKDNSSASGDDRGYFLIPKNQ